MSNSGSDSDSEECCAICCMEFGKDNWYKCQNTECAQKTCFACLEHALTDGKMSCFHCKRDIALVDILMGKNVKKLPSVIEAMMERIIMSKSTAYEIIAQEKRIIENAKISLAVLNDAIKRNVPILESERDVLKTRICYFIDNVTRMDVDLVGHAEAGPGVDRDADDVDDGFGNIIGKGLRVKKIFKACIDSACKGYSKNGTCMVCGKSTCMTCGEESKPGHVCRPEDIETMKTIALSSKQCPNCPTMIYKIEGCDQMFCTACNTVFSWNTGEAQRGGTVHNPHAIKAMETVKLSADLERQRKIREENERLAKFAKNTFDYKELQTKLARFADLPGTLREKYESYAISKRTKDMMEIINLEKQSAYVDYVKATIKQFTEKMIAEFPDGNYVWLKKNKAGEVRTTKHYEPDTEGAKRYVDPKFVQLYSDFVDNVRAVSKMFGFRAERDFISEKFDEFMANNRTVP